MNVNTWLSTIILVLFSQGINAQEIINAKKLGKMDGAAFKNLEEVNAMVFRPAGYDTVMNPKLPDSLSSLVMLSKEEVAEMNEKRRLFNPYLVFGDPIELRKGDVFISFSRSWIRLSSYYQYNTDTSSIETYRQKVNQNMVGKNMIGYNQNFELLEDVKGVPRELINADTVFIYDTKSTFKFKDTIGNYGSLVVHLVKFDLGYVSLRYYYPLDERKKALEEVNNTWGIIQFKPDNEFTHPIQEGRIPARKEPDLYLGKFSFLNNPEQVSREHKQYERRKLSGRANVMAMEAGRLAQSGDFDQAKHKLFEALTVDSNNVIAYRHLVLLSMDENDEDGTWDYWHRLMKRDSANTETWFLKGLAEKKYRELDSATKTFETIIKEKDSLHFRSFVELAFIAALKGAKDSADLNFNQAINIFNAEGEKSLRKESHRIFNINDLFKVRLAYAKFLNANFAFEKSRMLFEQTLIDEEMAIEAVKKGERQRIYGKLTPASLGELNFMLAISYAGLMDEPNTRLYLEKAKSLGKILPEELEGFLAN